MSEELRVFLAALNLMVKEVPTRDPLEGVPDEAKEVPIGSGKTVVGRKMYDAIKWQSYTFATRKLLVAVFGRQVLATHSLTGKRSPAFPDRQAKTPLDKNKISDVIMEVMKNCENVCINQIRQTITIKCADECKMLRNRCKNKNIGSKNKKKNKEN